MSWLQVPVSLSRCAVQFFLFPFVLEVTTVATICLIQFNIPVFKTLPTCLQTSWGEGLALCMPAKHGRFVCVWAGLLAVLICGVLFLSSHILFVLQSCFSAEHSVNYLGPTTVALQTAWMFIMRTSFVCCICYLVSCVKFQVNQPRITWYSGCIFWVSSLRK